MKYTSTILLKITPINVVVVNFSLGSLRTLLEILMNTQVLELNNPRQDLFVC